IKKYSLIRPGLPLSIQGTFQLQTSHQTETPLFSDHSHPLTEVLPHLSGACHTFSLTDPRHPSRYKEIRYNCSLPSRYSRAHWWPQLVYRNWPPPVRCVVSLRGTKAKQCSLPDL